MKRIFIAVNIEQKVKELLNPLYLELKRFKNLKPVSPEKFHLTIQFLGDTDDDTFNTLKDNFQDLNLPLQKIPYQVAGIGTFPRIKNARVIWCGIKTDRDKMNKLKQQIEQFCSQYGFSSDKREFKPHLTLARVRYNQSLDTDCIKLIEQNKNTMYGESCFKNIVLYESRLSPRGATYIEHVNILFE